MNQRPSCKAKEWVHRNTNWSMSGWRAFFFVQVARTSLNLCYSTTWRPSLLVLRPIYSNLRSGELSRSRQASGIPIRQMMMCFALFHFSSLQGVGNVSLILTLLVFGGFLGFIYERQSSLFASIGLHMTFNVASTLRILISPGE